MKKSMFIFCIIFVFFINTEAQSYVDSVKIAEINIAFLLYSLENKIKTCDNYISQDHEDDSSLSALQPMIDEIKKMSSDLSIAGMKRTFLLKKLHQERFLKSLDEKPDESERVYKPQIHRPKVYK